MPRGGQTQAGGSGGSSFEPTRWTEVIETRSPDPDRRREALGGLLERYWKPIYCYLRRKGYDNEKAKDLTQGFITEVVLGRGLVEQADQAKGKFRTFLLTALVRYTHSVYRAETAQKRHPAEGLVRLEGVLAGPLPEPTGDMPPDDAFTYAWASSLLDQVLEEVGEGCRRDGREVHWACFQGRVLGPIMDNADPVPLPELCRRHGIAEESMVSNMVSTVKRRFRKALERHVRPYVDADDQVDEEIRELMRILATGGAG